ncbi:iron chelate uptake ABC transporter family permease subunit [Agrobacterium rubi]|uniref:Iron chelate uptake ABC transporter family permease subunit n=2 Tax=Agrobacterium rubi TaxID=28099 RepID=A0AAE7R7A1_9HYPH|nr:iron chelate uptake ABC transporter family permease subunit [Agrobacterium rubi]NTE87412.1 iron chelate uptake ABC transporter family permease subunit [Agrobacterium rubi]NTF03266.1 iron chelate uptake ABC transporter family permease subunit [Agrobacterium rubi]NTF37426.1 iron chelate uptake ABC transporter family permease subunit [Agrobacterium rubi]OCJ53493.1 ABC transporter permease [Agrobacterium rubi]QTG02519.1 iron chelate uptake ABC transporter family permease subunit [Agrobacterium 
MTMLAPIVHSIVESRNKHGRKRLRVMAILVTLLIAVFSLTLVLGQSFTPPVDVMRVLLGENVAGAGFTVGQLRLPRALLSILAGLSFGLGGVAFQIMLRNPLASPDIIGISSGASAAAVFAIVVLSLKGPIVSVFAVGAGLGVALSVYGLSSRNGVAGTRLILVGIGVSAMLESIIAYILSTAPAWNLQEAMRWLTGSVNGAQLSQVLPLLLGLIVFGSLLLSRQRDLEALRLGDDTAAALGVRVGVTRVLVITAAVGMIAFATAITGPIAFVAFLSGPIAARIVGSHGSLLVPAALIGALLVLAGDYAGQLLLPSRYPVGVVTGALGAPYLIFLIIRANRSGGSL